MALLGATLEMQPTEKQRRPARLGRKDTEGYEMEMEGGDQNTHGLEATRLSIRNKIVNAVGSHRGPRDA